MKRWFIVAVLGIAVTAQAESLEEKQYWKGQTHHIDRELETANKVCGTELTFEWVDKPTLRAETEKTNHTPNGVCGAIIYQVAHICRGGDDGKAAVKATFKGFACGYAKERTLHLTKGVVRYMGNNAQANFSDWARPWLLKQL